MATALLRRGCPATLPVEAAVASSIVASMETAQSLLMSLHVTETASWLFQRLQ
jgi:hypothetical protein